MGNPRSSVDSPGLFGSVREFAASLGATISARLQLAGCEGREAGKHLAILLALLVGLIAFALMTWFFLCLGLAFLIARCFEDSTAWIWVVFGMAAVHLIAVLALAFVLKSKIGLPLFSLTLAEFKKDQQWLDQKN